jgi:hypothetical protein
MSRKERKGRSVNQLVGTVLRARGLDRDEGFAAYVGDRLLYRLGRSTEADEFYLKGGVLVGNLVDEPFRATRDLDFLRRHGSPDPDEMRQRFHAIASVPVDVGITFTRVRAEPTDRATDDYEGVKVFVEGSVEGHGAVVKIDVNDRRRRMAAIRPSAVRRRVGVSPERRLRPPERASPCTRRGSGRRTGLAAPVRRRARRGALG